MASQDHGAVGRRLRRDLAGQQRQRCGWAGDDSGSAIKAQVFALNHAPVATASGGTTAASEQIAVAVDAGLTLSDIESTTLASATVAITGGFQSGEDVLAFSNDGVTMGNIAANYAAGTGILTLTSAGATATVAQWQAALRAVTYTDSSDTPNTANRTISFTVNDGIEAGTASSKTVERGGGRRRAVRAQRRVRDA